MPMQPEATVAVSDRQEAHTFQFVPYKGDWRRAADMLEPAVALRRPLRLIFGIPLLLLGFVLSIAGAFFPLVGAFGGLAFVVSIVGCLGPLRSDLRYFRLLRRSLPTTLTVSLSGLVVTGIPSQDCCWQDVDHFAEGVEGIYLEFRVPTGALWVPARAFADPAEQAAFTHLMVSQGVRRRGVGSG